MSFCPDCGTELSKIDNFCGSCGSKNQPPAVDLAQKYMGSVVYAALCLLFLPIGGLIFDIVVSYVLGIFHLNPKLVDNLSASPYFALPIALGLATGFYLNRQNVRFGDLFAWLAPAAWFTWYLFAGGLNRFEWLLSPRGPECGECLEQLFFPIPLMFSVAYSVAALCQKIRLGAGKFFTSRRAS
jgi:hypothetical protein